MSEETNAPPAAAPAKSGGSKLVPIAMGFQTLLIAGVLALQFLHPSQANVGGGAKHESKGGEHGEAKGEGEHGEKKEGEEGGEHGEAASAPTTLVGPTVKMPEFVIHLRNPEVDRYARMTFEVEVGNEKDKTELTAQSPRVRDAFISYLSDRTVEELRGSEGLEKTKAALMVRFNAIAPSVHARALYVTDLVIQ